MLILDALFTNVLFKKKIKYKVSGWNVVPTQEKS
jgi:hypothetical protein